MAPCACRCLVVLAAAGAGDGGRRGAGPGRRARRGVHRQRPRRPHVREPRGRLRAASARCAPQLGAPARRLRGGDRRRRASTPARLAAFEQSWVHRALRLQSQLDAREPMLNSLWPHTHNSANSTAYAPSVSSLDPNQRWSILDQLRMGARAIELDLHPSPDGGGGRAVPRPARSTVGATIVHLGCSVDRPLRRRARRAAGVPRRPGQRAGGRAAVPREPARGRPRPARPRRPPTSSASSATSCSDRRPASPAPRCRSSAAAPTCSPRATACSSSATADRAAGARGCTSAAPVGTSAASATGTPPSPTASPPSASRWPTTPTGSACTRTPRGCRPWSTAATTPRRPTTCGPWSAAASTWSASTASTPTTAGSRRSIWSWAVDEPVADAAKQCVAWGTDARFRAAGCGEERGYACRDRRRRVGRARRRGSGVGRRGGVRDGRRARRPHRRRVGRTSSCASAAVDQRRAVAVDPQPAWRRRVGRRRRAGAGAGDTLRTDRLAADWPATGAAPVPLRRLAGGAAQPRLGSAARGGPGDLDLAVLVGEGDVEVDEVSPSSLRLPVTVIDRHERLARPRLLREAHLERAEVADADPVVDARARAAPSRTCRGRTPTAARRPGPCSRRGASG